MKTNETVVLDCRRIETLAWEYMEGNLPPLVHNSIGSHLAECDSCKSVYRKTELLTQLIKKQKSQNSSPFLVTRILNRLEGRNIPKRGISILLKPKWSIAIISIVIATGIIVGSNVSNGMLINNDSTKINSAEMYYADQLFFTEADYYTPGFEYLNE